MKVRSAMIVDDSDSDQFLARARLLQFDPEIEIVQAYDGQEALEKLEDPDVKPDVILLDINMPRMNGLEFLEQYSQRENQTTVVAMLTSSDQPSDKEAALSFGCVKDYFVKLFDESDWDKLTGL